ncbi:MAG: choice-of-anchor D domain-containing protein, partial [Terriglobia bacterium]
MRLTKSIRHTRVFALLLFVGLAFPSYLSGQSRFHFVTAPSLDPGQATGNVVTGDFNGDGKLDIATATGSDYYGYGSNPLKVMLFLGNGNGTFQARRQWDYSGLTGAIGSVGAVADFNGDGFLDLAVGHGLTTALPNGFGNQVTIHLGDGAGNLTPFSVFTTGGSGIPLVAADFNGDGKEDLLARTYDDQTVRLHLGYGDGTFPSGGEVVFYDAGSAGANMAVGDLNGDGHADVVMVRDNDVQSSLGTGAAGYFSWSTAIGLPSTGRWVTLGDLNGDGHLDAVVTANEHLFVLLGNGDGTFQPAVDYPVTNAVLYGAAVADFDNDGHADVAVANYGFLSGGENNQVLVFPGDGAGNLGSPETFTVAWAPGGVVARDFNNDGLPDLAVAYGDSSVISVLINSVLGPPNDNWVNAAVVDSLPYTSIVDTTQATTELTDPSPGCGYGNGHSVWYVFTPASNGTVTANTFGSNYDTILSAFTGAPGAFTWQACNDDYAGFQSQISFGVTAGVMYSFMVTSYGSGNGGSLVFNLSFIPAGPYVSLSPTTLPFGNQVVNTTSAAQTVTVTNVGNADLVVSGVSLTGSMPGDFAIVSDGCTGAYVVPSAFCTFGVTFTPTAAGARTANVSISDNAPDTPQTVSLTGTGLAGPPNDNWANAAVISGTPYTNTVDTTQATTEGTDPSPGCGNGSTAKSVWYVFTATQDGTVTANTIGSNYDTILSAFTGTPGAFTLQACNDDYSGLQSQISFSVIAGVTYSFMPTSYGSGGGSLVFNLSFTPTAPYVSLSPTAVDFGEQVVNTTSSTQTVTVTNVGNTDLAVSGVSLTGLIPQDFMIVSDTCSGAYVVPSGSCTIGVTFTPHDLGSRTAQINIYDNAYDAPQTVPLQGMGIVQPPEVTWLSPWSAAPGGPEFTLTVNGSWFTSNSVVRWNGSDRVTTFLSDTQLQATIPASDIAAQGSAQVTVYTPDAGTSKTLTFAIEFNTLFRADFEAGTQGFAASNVINTLTWQRTTNRGADVGHSPTTSFYFGNPSTFNYQTCCREGAVLTSSPISLGAAPLTLTFNYFLATENFDYYDIAEVQVSNDGGYTFIPLISNRSNSVLVDNTGSWLSATADLSSYAGQTVVLRFSFDSVDSVANNFEGWYVDDVVVQSSGPSVQLSLTSLGFGNQLISTTSTPLTETATNTGTTTLAISDVSLTGTNPGDFAKTGDTCTGANVAPANSCTITVTFTPTTTGARSATLSISDNASGSPQTVTLSGTGTGGAAVGLSSASLDFGNQLKNTTSAPLTETVTNTGATTLTISGVSLTGTNPGDFAKTGDTCTGANVAPANSCTITVTFTPTTTGARSATLSITDNAPDSPQTVPLTGTGTAPTVGLSLASLAFGNQLKNTTSSPLTETVTNTGTGTLTISGVSLTGTNPGDFAKTGDTCTGANVAPSSTCIITVTFTPTATGARSATLSISDNASGSPHTVPLTGTGTAPTVGLSSASLNFGNQLKNTTSAPLTETVTNTGTATLTISGVSLTGTNPGDFAKTGDTCTGANVAPSSTCTITVTFTPTTTGARSATLSISDNATGSPHAVPLSGTGTAPA